MTKNELAASYDAIQIKRNESIHELFKKALFDIPNLENLYIDYSNGDLKLLEIHPTYILVDTVFEEFPENYKESGDPYKIYLENYEDLGDDDCVVDIELEVNTINAILIGYYV